MDVPTWPDDARRATMPRIVFAPETFNLAETTRCLEVARHLRDRYRCVFVGYSPRFAGLVRDAGFELELLEPVLTPAAEDRMLRFDQGRSLRLPISRADLDARVRHEIEVLRRVAPRAAVIGSTLTMLVSARAAEVPLVYVKPYAFSSPHLRTVRSVPVLLGESAMARVANRAVGSALRALSHLSVTPGLFVQLARRHGVEPPRGWATMLDADLNLLTSGPDEEGPLPADHEVVGPVFADLAAAGATGAGARAPDADRTESQVSRYLSDPRPRLFFAVGSSGDRALVLRCLEALGGLPVVVLAPVESYLQPEDLVAVPDNVLLCGWVSTGPVLAGSDAAVTHGGEGTVQAVTAAGLPFVGIALQMEQALTLDVCRRRGRAVVLGRRARVSRIRSAVREVLGSARMREAAARNRGQGGVGARRAAAAVDRVCGGTGLEEPTGPGS